VAALPASVEAATFGFFPCPSNEIARCILTDPSKAYSDPGLARRYAEVTRTVSRWDARLGTGHPNLWLAVQLDRAARHFPPPWLWLVLAVVALPLRRPRGAGVLVTLVGLAGMVRTLGRRVGSRPMRTPCCQQRSLLRFAPVLGRGPRSKQVERSRKQEASRAEATIVVVAVGPESSTERCRS
jgi:hypothetical protein